LCFLHVVGGFACLEGNEGASPPTSTTIDFSSVAGCLLQACKSLAATKSVGRDAELVLESVLGEGSYGKVSIALCTCSI
jgi:hypothetical protein